MIRHVTMTTAIGHTAATTRFTPLPPTRQATAYGQREHWSSTNPAVAISRAIAQTRS